MSDRADYDPEDVIHEEGPVKVIRRPKTNVRPDIERFQELGVRTLRIKSGKQAATGKPLIVSMEDLNQLHEKTGTWMSNIRNLKESDLNATNTNAANQARVQRGPRQAPAAVAVRKVGGTRAAQVAAAPPRRPAPPPQRAPRVAEVAYDELPMEFETDTDDGFSNPPEEVENTGDGGLGILEDRVSYLERGVEQIIGLLEDKKQNNEAEAHQDFPWCGGDMKPLPPAFIAKIVTPSITIESKYHHIVINPLFVVLVMDARDEKAARTWPTQSDTGFQIQIPTPDGQVTALYVAHIGLQFSFGPMDVLVLPVVPKSELEQQAHAEPPPVRSWTNELEGADPTGPAAP